MSEIIKPGGVQPLVFESTTKVDKQWYYPCESFIEVYQLVYHGEAVAAPFDHYPTKEEMLEIMRRNRKYDLKVEKHFKLIGAVDAPIGGVRMFAEEKASETHAVKNEPFPDTTNATDLQMAIMGELEAEIGAYRDRMGRKPAVIVLGAAAHDVLRTAPHGGKGGGDLQKYDGIPVLKGDYNIRVTAVYVGG